MTMFSDIDYALKDHGDPQERPPIVLARAEGTT
jgi:hypothetical protein